MGQLDRSHAPPLHDAQIAAFIQTVVQHPACQRHDRTEGWFQRYCGDLAEPARAQRYVSAIRRALQLDEHPVMGLRVLEIGSGFGLTSTALAMMGAQVVHALDSHAPMVATCRSYIPTWPHPLPVVAEVGQAHALPYANKHFDLVVTVEALSHFLHPQQCLAEAHRVLKPGGRLVIADDNNALNPESVATTQAVWSRFENGPPTEDIHGHRVRVPYVQRRQQLIEQAYPDLSGDAAQRIARGTAYMVKDDILKAVAQYHQDGTLPQSHFQPDRCPVEPESGQFIENLIDPLRLASDLEALGFDAKAEAYFGGESRGGVVWATNRLLNDWVPSSLLFARSEGFRIRAIKRG